MTPLRAAFPGLWTRTMTAAKTGITSEWREKSFFGKTAAMSKIE